MEDPYRIHTQRNFTVKQPELYSIKCLSSFDQLSEKNVSERLNYFNAQTANIRAVMTSSPS
jgi:hypothetical protein